jgi:hypothetical protein
MNDRRDILKELMQSSELTRSQKMKKIIKAIILTEDMMKAKVLSNQIIDGELDKINDKIIDNIIAEFSREDGENIKIVKEEFGEIDSKSEVATDTNSIELNQEIALLRAVVVKLQEEKKQSETKLKVIEEENEKLREMVKLTKIQEPIVVDDEDINELYIRFKNDGTREYNGAFVTGNIIPKEYYEI